uniref:cobyrinate a,c-diamide synthase n=1 Tax=Tessaracoccus sp. TaxID=1971211 RepID=UPI00263655B6|nr:cobyrinate a,c-diamide synthase [Tessaracoccus sp.]
MHETPRCVIAAPASGHGKTTVATGVMAALRERGVEVAPFKVGPDYIDPGYHTLASGRPGRNLDPFLCGEDLMAPLLLHGFEGADVAVVEGAMGLFDGKLGTDGFASTAHVARLIDAPVVLVVDARHASRSVGALVLGMATFDPGIRIAGVVLNQIGSPRHEAEARAAVERVGVPVLGVLPRNLEIEAPSRHLGLVPAAERDDAGILAMGRVIAEHVDLDALLAIARTAPPLKAEPWVPSIGFTSTRRRGSARGVGSARRDTDGGRLRRRDPAQPAADHDRSLSRAAARSAAPVSKRIDPTTDTRPKVAIAGGRAFTFRYPETDELLIAAGCEPVIFDPLTDTELPAGTAGLWLGGGFPEMHAGDLAANTPLLAAIREAVADGMPTVAECAGLLYLSEELDGEPMVGALPGTTAMTARLTMGYREATAEADSLLGRVGEKVTGHEFHRTTADPGETAAWLLDGRRDGVATPTLHASYLHVHWAGHPQLARRFAEAVHGWASRVTAIGFDTGARSSRPGSTSETNELHPVSYGTDILHHGDKDIQPGLVDFAVNVRQPHTPDWLVDAIARDADWAVYPDPAPARAAIAAHHGVGEEMVLPVAGGAEAFTLIARAIPGEALVVHPQFTEPDAALLAAGRTPRHHILTVDAGFRLDPGAAPAADLVLVGNPTNPTGVLHRREDLLALRARTLVIDEAFLDTVPGEPETLIAADMPGRLVLRSLTKTWAIAGIRAGYVVGDPRLIARLATQQPPWSVSTPAIAATVACLDPERRDESSRLAADGVAARRDLADRLGAVGLHPVQGEAPFVLVDTADVAPRSLREELAARGYAVRRGESFPGLGPTWLRLAARTPDHHAGLIAALLDIKEARCSKN